MRFELHIAALMTVGALGACGAPEGSARVATAAPGPSADAKPQAPSTAVIPACPAGTRKFTLAKASQLHWLAQKNTDVPVIGTHPVTGTVTTAADAVGLELTFALAGFSSALALRDERLKKIIFGDEVVTFAATLPATPLPTAGNPVAVPLAGTLALAGREIPLQLEALLAATSQGLRVQESIKGVTLSLSDLGLSAATTTLLALVPGVTLEDEVQIRFGLDLVPTCRGS